MSKDDSCKRNSVASDGALSFFGLLAYIGAASYFISITDGTFWAVILGLLKAIVWPAYAIYHLLQYLGA